MKQGGKAAFAAFPRPEREQEQQYQRQVGYEPGSVLPPERCEFRGMENTSASNGVDVRQFTASARCQLSPRSVMALGC